uniref:Uncharacterized protein n=1 Tax=Cucumis melo TaxID=3656 RepID=A0A9I9EAR0_CUCME
MEGNRMICILHFKSLVSLILEVTLITLGGLRYLPVFHARYLSTAPLRGHPPTKDSHYEPAWLLKYPSRFIVSKDESILEEDCITGSSVGSPKHLVKQRLGKEKRSGVEGIKVRYHAGPRTCDHHEEPQISNATHLACMTYLVQQLLELDVSNVIMFEYMPVTLMSLKTIKSKTPEKSHGEIVKNYYVHMPDHASSFQIHFLSIFVVYELLRTSTRDSWTTITACLFRSTIAQSFL